MQIYATGWPSVASDPSFLNWQDLDAAEMRDFVAAFREGKLQAEKLEIVRSCETIQRRAALLGRALGRDSRGSNRTCQAQAKR